MSQALAVAEQGGASFEIAQPVLDTPRTRQACRKLGLVIEDLQHRTYESFAIPGDRKEKQQLRFEHYEKKRKERLAQVLAERAKVIAENAKKGSVPGVQSAQFLTMLESLFEKEAHRLETDLKSQLRHHSNLVTENEMQLTKEEKRLSMDKRRDDRRAAASQMRQDEAERVRTNSDRRKGMQTDNYSKMEDEFSNRQMSQKDELQAEQDRLDRFMMEKASLQGDKAAVWKAKTDAMKAKSQNMALQRFEDGEMSIQRIETRLAGVDMRRDEDSKNLALRCEQQHLKLMDVRSQKDRIDRVDGYRKDELKEHLDSNVERIETLLALKDQLLDQRRARTLKAEATKNSRGLNLRRDCAPGPGQYEAPKSCLEELPVSKINPSTKMSHSEFIDAQVRVTAANPAPGAYAANVMPNGDKLGEAAGGVNFGDRDKTTYLDDAIRQKSFVPAPGRYEVKSGRDERATRMRRDTVDDAGLDKKSAKRYPIWARPSTETPGPAGYSVDEYQRKEVLRRAQKSLPNLTRDMLRNIPGSQSATAL